MTHRKKLLSSAGISTIPVNLAKLLRHWGISTLSADFTALQETDEFREQVKIRGDILGAVGKKGDDLCIYYKYDDNIHSQRFTIAHELGHIIIPWHSGVSLDNQTYRYDSDTAFYKSGSSRLLDMQELEAHVFASELLMPYEWLQRKIDEHEAPTFNHMVQCIQREAQTSIMACFYALENALPSGHLFFVRKEFGEYWMRFASKRTFQPSSIYDFEEKTEYLDTISKSKEQFHISQYDVIHYTLQPIPNKDTINQIYMQSDDIIECLNVISDYRIQDIISSIKFILDCLDESFVAFVYSGNQVSGRISKNGSKIRYNGQTKDRLMELLNFHCVGYYFDEAFDFNSGIIFIKEHRFGFPSVNRCDPNKLLRNIVQDLNCEDDGKKLRSINGIVSSINSTHKQSTAEEMYNSIKYRFILDEENCEFYEHQNFDLYASNKVLDMIKKRKK